MVFLDRRYQMDNPDHWLKKRLETMLSEEVKARIQSLGGLDKLMETFRQRMQEQKDRHQGGNIEHYNEEAGAVWMQHIADTFEHLVWINPTPKEYWEHSYSIAIVKQVLHGRRYPMTIRGLEDAVNLLAKF